MAGNTGPAHILLDNSNFAKYPTITETQTQASVKCYGAVNE
jgi:hypothetical protein